MCHPLLLPPAASPLALGDSFHIASGRGLARRIMVSEQDVSAFHAKVTSMLLLVLQLGLIGCFCLSTYGEFDLNDYQAYIGVTLMMMVGFGYLMAFLKMYGLGAVGFTYVLTALCVQLNALLAPAISKEPPSKPVLSAYSLMDGNFAAATILISFGCIIGKASPTQLVLMAVIESVLFQLNRNLICVETLHIEARLPRSSTSSTSSSRGGGGGGGLCVWVAFWRPERRICQRDVAAAQDAGGTIVIHMFGAYFGLGLARVLGKPQVTKYCTNSIVSDLLSLIGTMFLWVYWPTFNGAVFFTGPRATIDPNRCIVNTVVALCASCVTAFGISGLLSKRFSPADIQNSSLAGGVVVGAIARMDVEPAWAAGLGMVAAAVSVWGYQRLQPWLLEKLGLHDSCGVHNLHGMPSIIGALASVVAVLVVHDSPEYTKFDRGTQALNQFFAILSTLGISISGGVATGYFLKAVDRAMKRAVRADASAAAWDFTDATYWNVGESKLTGSDFSVSTKHGGTAWISRANPPDVTDGFAQVIPGAQVAAGAQVAPAP